MASLKTASFTVPATADQSAEWRWAAKEEGFRSVCTWLAFAVDAYVNARAGDPLPLVWIRGTVKVDRPDGSTVDVPGWQAEPYVIFRGNRSGPALPGCKRFSLLYLPQGRILVTFRSMKDCREMADIIEKGRKV